MRTALKLLGVIAFTSAAFAAGAVTAVLREWGSPLVFVTVHNDTSAEIRSLSLNITSCGSTSQLASAALPRGHTHTFRFAVCGEAAYDLEAALADGSILKSQAYVERGYSVNEHVQQARIRATTRAFHL